MASGISTTDVQRAARELAGMKRSLRSWMKYRALNDAHGAAQRDWRAEQGLATKLRALLGALYPSARLPSSDLSRNPTGAVQLAQIALSGQPPSSSASAMSGVMATHPWLVPVLVAGGLLIAVTTAIKSAADLASQKEQDACIASGACTDYGFWLKWGGIAMLAYVAWNQFGVRHMVQSALAKGRR